MGGITRPCRLAGLAIIVALAASVHSAGAYTVPRGTHDGALVEFQGDTGGEPIAIYLNATQWGTQYYSGLPPQNNGGLGDGVVCLSIYIGDGVRGEGCFDGVDAEFESLRSLTIDDAVPMDMYDGNDNFIGTQTVTIDVTLTGSGAPYPGAGVQLNPSPGIEFQYSFLRNATIAGTIESQASGSVDLASGAATLGHDECVALMVREDHVEACRF
jgi:hypothetical protein